MAPHAALAALASRPAGLDQAEAERRLARFGPNRLTEPPRRGALRRFAAQFNDVLIYVLIASGGVTFAMGHLVDAGVIYGVIVINAIVGFIQEGRAERALEGIARLLAPRANVRRGGKLGNLPAERVVPGDIVVVQPGDRVPADLRLVEARNLRLQEAVLTGESVAVDKRLDPVDSAAALADRASMVYAGTLVVGGHGAGVAVATGDAAEIGRIGRLVASVTPLATPLVRKLQHFGRWLTIAILLLAGVVFLFGFFVRGFAAEVMFLAAVGLAVAAIPEGLPVIVTIALAMGVQRMARRNAIVRRLPAVEALGSVTVICSDKTGTLTKNEMTAAAVGLAGQAFDVSGVGYAPVGGFAAAGRPVDPAERPDLVEALRIGLLCNDAELRRAGEAWHIEGDPTEGALVVAAAKAGLDAGEERVRQPRTDVVPFESERRLMATLHHDHAGHAFIAIKGAPERVIAACARARHRHGEVAVDHRYWEACIHGFAAAGQRVLAVATKRVPPTHRELRLADLDDGFTLLGVFGLIDPPREEGIAAVAACRRAGVRVKMITGDHMVTARAVARALQLGNVAEALTGPDIDRLDETALRTRAREVDVFARMGPEHKLRLVEALQAEGEVVAMTGDGVNDAPALKRADIGVAMGREGTEAAKEAAQIVLADDNFASIAAAVEEGRTAYDNLRKAILFILPTNAAEAFMIVLAVMFGAVLPITPVQILWVNMVTEITLSLALAAEPGERDLMRRPPRRPDEPLLSRFLLGRTVLVTIVAVAGTFGLFLLELERGASLEVARTVAVNTLVLFEAFYLFNARYLVASSLGRAGLAGNPMIWGALGLLVLLQLAFTYLPVGQTLFATADLAVGQWLTMTVVASSVFIVVEAEKWLLRWDATKGRR